MAGNSELPPRDVLDPWLQKADVVVAADGGANRLLALGIEPDAVVGDMDSVLGSTRRRLPRARFHPRKSVYRTDLEKAIEYVAGRGYNDVTVVGASQGRLDHVLGAVALLLEWGTRTRIRLVDAEFTTERVDGATRFRAPRGTVVSLWSPTVARGVTTRGLRWPLGNATLRRGTLGIHNHVVANPVQVTVTEGDLLLLRGHWMEPHTNRPRTPTGSRG